MCSLKYLIGTEKLRLLRKYECIIFLRNCKKKNYFKQISFHEMTDYTD